MRIRTLGKLCSAGFFVSILAACGGGGSNSGCTPGNPGCNDPVATTVSLSGGGVKGPITGATTTLSQAEVAGGEVTAGAVIDTGLSGPDGLVNLTNIPSTAVPPFILEVDGAGGIDIGTGNAPAITQLKTIVTQAMLDSGEPVFATLLTTVATDLAAANATSAADLGDQLALASAQTLAVLGFGADISIDVFTTPPILTDAVSGFDGAESVVALRTANESLGAAILMATGAPNDVLGKIADDLADGALDEDVGAGADADLAGLVAALTGGVSAATPLPGATGGETLADVQGDVATEAATTGQTPDAAVAAIVASAVPLAPIVLPTAGDLMLDADTDNDGTPDATDAFPGDPDGQTDANGNGVPDELEGDTDTDTVIDANDNCPADPNTAQMDMDSDGVGDVCDDLPNDATASVDTDTDGVGDNLDNCQMVANGANDPSNQLDNDNDGLGDACDNDADGDGVDGDGSGGPDIPGGDANDLNTVIGIDDDEDGTTDVAGAGFNGPDNCLGLANDQANLDGDMLGNACDADADGDGVDGDGSGGPDIPGGDADDLNTVIGIDDDEDGTTDVAGAGFNGPDNCLGLANDQANLDGDMLGNACDADADGDGVDGDGSGGPDIPGGDADDLNTVLGIDDDEDGTTDVAGAGFNGPDNCLGLPNDQANFDGDAFGNACDADADGDGVDGDGSGGSDIPGGDADDLNTVIGIDDDEDGTTDVAGAGFNGPDNCLGLANDQANLDGDALGNVCDADADGDGENGTAKTPPGLDENDLDANVITDTDSDGIDDNAVGLGPDLCPLTANADNTAAATSGLGVICDPDDDGVGTAPELGMDNCPDVANAAGQGDDLDTDGEGDACDTDIDGDTILNDDDPVQDNAAASYHLDLSAAALFATVDQTTFGFFKGTESTVSAFSSTPIDTVDDNVLSLPAGSGALALDHDNAESYTDLTLGGACIAGTDCTTASTPLVTSEAETVFDNNRSVNAVYDSASKSLTLDFGEFDIVGEYDSGTTGQLEVDTDITYGVGGSLLSSLGQSFVGTRNLSTSIYPLEDGTGCAAALGLTFTSAPELESDVGTLVGGNPAGAAATVQATPACVASGEFKIQELVVLSPEPNGAALVTADLDGLSYGLVEYASYYDTDTANNLQTLETKVSHLAVSTAGAVTQSVAVGVYSSIGTNNGSLEFDTTASGISSITVDAAGTGEFAIGGGSDLNSGIAANDLQLLTLLGNVNSPTQGLNRGYAVQLGSSVAETDLDGMSYDLHGTTVNAGSGDTALSNYSGGMITFDESGGTLTATLSGSVATAAAAFDDANNNLPTLADGSSDLAGLVSNSFNLDDEGRFDVITFPGSGLQLEGFYTANGLLLRLVDTLAATNGSGGGGGASGPGLQSGPSTFIPLGMVGDDPTVIETFQGVIPQICIVTVAPGELCPDEDDPMTPEDEDKLVDVTPCELDVNGQPDGSGGQFCPLLFQVTLMGGIRSGYWTISSGGGTPGVEAPFTGLARTNAGTPQSYADIDTAGGEAYDSYNVTQGVLIGTPVAQFAEM